MAATPPEIQNPNLVASPANGARRAGVIALVFVLIFIAQSLWFIQTQGFTVDEPGHLAAALSMWRNGRFVILNDQPPLARKLFGWPLAKFTTAAVDNHLETLPAISPTMRWYSRPMMTLLGLALALLLWAVTRRNLSAGAAAFALGLYAFSPDVIAHFSLATMDGSGALTIFAAAIALAWWREGQNDARTMVLAVALGLMLAAKFYTLPLFAVALGLMLILREEGIALAPRRWNWKPALAAAFVSWMVVSALYNFHISLVSVEHGAIVMHMPHRERHFGEFFAWLPKSWDFRFYLPAAEFWDGVYKVSRHDQEGHKSFFLGAISSTGGWKLYHPVSMLLKWPTTVLLLAGTGVGLIARGKVKVHRGWWLAAVLPLTLLAIAIPAHIQIGVRHMLPLYIFVLVLASVPWMYAADKKTWRIVLMAALALNAADALRYAPDYLSYFNPFIAQDQTWKYLADSNNDWGQGLLAVKRYQQAHPGEHLFLSYAAYPKPEVYGIRDFTLIEPGDRPSGTVIVTANELSGQFLKDPNGFHWVLRYPRKAILNHTMFVFEVPPNAK